MKAASPFAKMLVMFERKISFFLNTDESMILPRTKKKRHIFINKFFLFLFVSHFVYESGKFCLDMHCEPSKKKDLAFENIFFRISVVEKQFLLGFKDNSIQQYTFFTVTNNVH